MTLHYHGTPIAPRRVLEQLAGGCFCVSFADPRDCKRVHEIGQSVMLDNGAFSLWNSGKVVDWNDFYAWVDPWLDYPTTWAIPPDVIEGEECDNDRLLLDFPFPRKKGKPVWHLHESLDRLLRLLDEWPDGVCFGSSAQFASVGSESWHRRVAEAWDAIAVRHAKTPWVHMLRGLKTVRMGCYPFASVDSTDIARNHHIKGHARLMMDEWNGVQCPGKWITTEQHTSLFGEDL